MILLPTCITWTWIRYPFTQTLNLCLCRTWHIKSESKWLPFADDIFNYFLEWKCCIWIQILPKCVVYGVYGPIDNKSALAQVKAWRRTGDKPLPGSMATYFTDACTRVTRPRCSFDYRGEFILSTSKYLERRVIIFWQRKQLLGPHHHNMVVKVALRSSILEAIWSGWNWTRDHSFIILIN